MNGMLKLWTSILTNIGSPWAKTQGILSDTADEFRRHRKIYDSLSTHILMYEDAKMSKKHIYTAYSDFKGAYGGMDHIILFKTMRDLGFQECYINTCEQLYKVSGTYYMTPHGNTPKNTHPSRHTQRRHPLPLPIHDIHGTTTTVALHRE